MDCKLLSNSIQFNWRYIDDVLSLNYPEFGYYLGQMYFAELDNPEFAEHISDLYPKELQMNKANTSDKETSFWDLNIKVIGSNMYTSVYDKRDDFGFPIVNSPG